MYGSILINGIEVTVYPTNDGGLWYFDPATGNYRNRGVVT